MTHTKNIIKNQTQIRKKEKKNNDFSLLCTLTQSKDMDKGRRRRKSLHFQKQEYDIFEKTEKAEP